MSLTGPVTVADYSGVSYNGHTPTETRTQVDQDEVQGNPHHLHDEEEEANRQLEATKLARTLSRASTKTKVEGLADKDPVNAFIHPEPDSVLDPNGSNFSYKAWAKALLSARDPNDNPLRTSGIAFRNLSVHGFGSATDYQKTFFNSPLEAVTVAKGLFGIRKDQKIQILRDFDGILHSGEMLVVLGPPGSGCSTLLKTIAGETHGLHVSPDSLMNYKGISPKEMQKEFKGEAVYCGEVDVHFPQLSVSDTLQMAAMARSPRHPPAGLSQWQWAETRRDAIMACFGISHTKNTRVGNELVRGVSGGERKRVTIAEAALSEAPLACWDNSTRGLDSANAIEFCRTLKLQAELLGTTACVAIYQAPQAAYECFNKVALLYEGRQIFYGDIYKAKTFFTDMGFYCPDQQTIPDFLTSLTSPIERRIQPGFENKAPRTPDEFVQRWKESDVYRELIAEIDAYNAKYPVGGEELEKFKHSRRAQQAKNQRVTSPFTLSYGGQIRLCLWRGWRRLVGDPSLTFAQLFGNTVMGLIISSMFYNLKQDTASFYSRSALLFFAILLAAFASALEILVLYAQRPIVEKHDRYAFYHPSAEAFASMLMDMPYKITNTICFNLILYFMTNLRREPGAFFFYLLITFMLTLIMSSLFRFIGSISRTLAQALTPAAILMLALVIYTGFALSPQNMLGWASWIRWLVPIYYGFEALMINEFKGRGFDCSSFVPSGAGYDGVSGANRICSAQGSLSGQSIIPGQQYIESTYAYRVTHKWRNVGILFGFFFFQTVIYIIAAEAVRSKKSRGEVLVFQRKHLQEAQKKIVTTGDPEKAGSGMQEKSLSASEEEDFGLIKQTAIFHWSDVCYDIKIKGEDRRILDHVDGWIKPGTLTCLMGVSGAGKTTLLDVLATRTTMGVITGDIFVDGKPRDTSFQRKTGYCMQQDIHLPTATVRESLEFSALMRQPATFSREEKLAYVDEVIKILNMEDYADAVVGVLGEGLNVEQRKRLTIGVELAAKPQLLIFLDEPTSGLDSQTSWAICDLMEKLAKHNQAVLCTLHQPSAMLFSRFDRLLLLARGGRTIYFGPIGENSHVLMNYFTSHGAKPLPEGANPAEYMLHIIGAAPGAHTDFDWHEVWRNSEEYKAVKSELRQMEEELPAKAEKLSVVSSHTKAEFSEFAAPFSAQFQQVFKRVLQQYLRSPTYLYAKYGLLIGAGLFIGFSFFKAGTSLLQLQNQMFSIFMLMTVFAQLTQQIQPNFVEQRSLYEVRERPAKTYSWQAWLLANILIEIPFNIFGAVVLYFCFYYPVGFYRNAEPTHAVTERGGLFFCMVLVFLVFASTFAHMLISGMETAENAGNLGNVLFSLSLVFTGVLVPKTALGWWVWMYYVSPFTYVIGGMLSAAVSNTHVTCGAYMADYISAVGGYLIDSNETSDCQFCTTSSTNTFLASISIKPDDGWRNFGIIWIYCAFNLAAAFFLYWLVRVPKKAKKSKAE